MYFNNYIISINSYNRIVGKERSSSLDVKSNDKIKKFIVTKEVYESIKFSQIQEFFYDEVTKKVSFKNKPAVAIPNSNKEISIVPKMWFYFLEELQKTDGIPITDKISVEKLLFVYNLDTKEYSSVQGVWQFNGKLYSAKYSYGKGITDLYLINDDDDLRSFEIEKHTLKPIVKYIDKGMTKVDMEGNILQKNYAIEDKSELPTEFLNDLTDVEFSLDDIIVYSHKPYGRTVDVKYFGRYN